MFRLACLLTLVFGMSVLASGAAAADPPPAEILHAPQKVEPAPVAPVWVYPVPPPLPYQRINRWDVWQNYGVDRQGYWRPRVAYTPYGAFYLFNGQPYPYTAIHQRDFMPYVWGE
jgi:hypothetical protein